MKKTARKKANSTYYAERLQKTVSSSFSFQGREHVQVKRELYEWREEALAYPKHWNAKVFAMC